MAKTPPPRSRLGRRGKSRIRSKAEIERLSRVFAEAERTETSSQRSVRRWEDGERSEPLLAQGARHFPESDVK